MISLIFNEKELRNQESIRNVCFIYNLNRVCI
jgi:hypothetical protein